MPTHINTGHIDILMLPCLQVSGARVVVLNVFEDLARELFCLVSIAQVLVCVWYTHDSVCMSDDLCW